jgi:hypothetical protein
MSEYRPVGQDPSQDSRWIPASAGMTLVRSGLRVIEPEGITDLNADLY